jgi:hypothetical protein
MQDATDRKYKAFRKNIDKLKKSIFQYKEDTRITLHHAGEFACQRTGPNTVQLTLFQVVAAEEDSGGACAQSFPSVERRWCRLDDPVPGPTGLPADSLGDDGPGSVREPTARRALDQAKRPREAESEDEETGERRAKSPKVDRCSNKPRPYIPADDLPDMRFEWGQYVGRLMSEVMQNGEAASYLRWLTSPNFRANKSNVKLLDVARAHLKAFEESCKPTSL